MPLTRIERAGSLRLSELIVKGQFLAEIAIHKFHPSRVLGFLYVVRQAFTNLLQAQIRENDVVTSGRKYQ